MKSSEAVSKKDLRLKKLSIFGMIFSLPLLIWQTMHKNVLELDALHHGLIFPAAVAVKDGLIPHLDVFAQYGPLNPILQGFWLKVFGARIFQMQTFTVLVVSMIALLLFLFCKPYLGVFSSYLVAITWIVTGPHGLPWASLPTNMLIMSAFLLLVRQSKQTALDKRLKTFDFAAGALMSIAIFGRVQSALLVASVQVLLLFLNRRRGYSFLAGNCVSLSLGFGVLQVNGAAIAYFNECVLWASRTLGYAEVPTMSKAFLFDVSFFIWIPAALTLVLFVAKYLNLRCSRRISFPFYFALVLISITFGIVSNQDLDVFHPNLSSKPFSTKLEYAFIVISKKFLFALDFAPLLFFVVLVALTLIRARRKRWFLSQEKWIALTIGVFCLSQMWPIADSYHMWFLSPILIASSIVLGHDLRLFNYKKYVNSLLVILLLGLQVQSFVNFAKPRYSFSNPVLQGMYSSLQDAPSIDRTMSYLDKFITKGSTRFECPEGLYAASGGTFKSVDSNFVNWSSKVGSSISSYSYIFICRTSLSNLRKFDEAIWTQVFLVSNASNPNVVNVLLHRRGD